MAALSSSQAAGHLGESYLFQSSDCCQMAATSSCIHAFDTCQEWFLTARGRDISETGKMALAPIIFKQRHKLHVQKYNSSQDKNRKVSLCDCPAGPSTEQVTSDTDTTSFPPVSCSVAGKLAQRSNIEKYIWWKRCNPSVNPAGRSVALHCRGRSVTLQTLQGRPEDPWPARFFVCPFHLASIGHTYYRN